MQYCGMSIQVKSINKSYGDTQVLHDISFDCESGETLVLLGPSGAGKSSLLRVLNLLEIADNGELDIANEQFDFSSQIQEKQGLKLRRKVGMVFQQYNLWPHMTVMENLIEAPTKVAGLDKQEAIKQAQEVLKTLQLADKADAWPLQLSGGQQQRVAIARALMMKPDVLLFDEPTAALDPEITNQVVSIIKELSGTGITQVVVTHEVDFAKKIASHVLYLEKGNIVEHGTSDSFVNPQTPEFAEYLTH
ncbi:arginine ABC transporter ATP-binding protein ArtP [Vibrio gigantis]